jgi:hypothetical protein
MKLEAVRKVSLALPEVAEAPHFHYTSFRVRGKIFATAPPTGEHVHIFIKDEDLELALTLHPKFIEKLFWGGKVAGARVILAKAQPQVVAELLEKSWRRKAPKMLARMLPSAPPNEINE